MEAGSNQGRPFYHSIISSRMKLNSQQGYMSSYNLHAPRTGKDAVG